MCKVYDLASNGITAPFFNLITISVKHTLWDKGTYKNYEYNFYMFMTSPKNQLKNFTFKKFS